MSFFENPLHDREHANSYYASSQRDKVDFPQLQDNISADICIVGGGLSGVATAVELSEQGFQVVVLEAQRVGWGASGRNGGQVIGGFGEALSGSLEKVGRKFGVGASEALRGMGIECVDIVRERVAKYGIECDLKWGYFDAAMKAREMYSLADWHEELQQSNYPHRLELIDRDGVQDIVGSEHYIGGLVNEGYGHVHVLDLCKGEARAAESLGARIFEQSMVTSIDHGETATVYTAKGSVKARFLVLCGNAYMSQLTPELFPKLSSYVLPASSYVIATEPLSEELAESVLARDYAVCDQRTALDYFRLSADRRLLFGGMSNYSARDPRSITGVMQPSMLKVFPQLRDVKIDFEWGGHMGIGLNRVPQFGQLESNVYYVQAYSGHGVAPTHMSGRILAEVITSQAQRFDIMSRVKHLAFPGGQLFRQPLLALGMMFYKIRDEIY